MFRYARLLKFAPGPLGFVALAALYLAANPPNTTAADWGFVKVFDFVDGYPDSGENIFLSTTHYSFHGEAFMFGVGSGSTTGIFRYERGAIESFVDTDPNTIQSFTNVSVTSVEAHDPFAIFIAQPSSTDTLYARSVESDRLFNIATSSTPIPGGSGNFTGFPDSSLDGQRVTFHGRGANDQTGLYAKNIENGNNIELIVDKGDVIPGPTFNTFQDFGGISHHGNNIVFQGHGNSFLSGVYEYSFDTSFPTQTRIADTDTTIPGSAETFSQFWSPSFDGQSTVFRGSSSQSGGVFTNQGGPLRAVVEVGDPIPDGTGNFSGFSSVASIDNGNIAFDGAGTNERGIYLEKNGVLEKVIASGDVIDGRTVQFVNFGRDGLSGENLGMRIDFTDGGKAYYAAFTEHRWDPAGGAGGNWDDQANWPLGARPNTRVHTFIEPDGPALVQGPTTLTQMRSLTIGAQTTGTAALHLQPTGQVLIDEVLTVQAAGLLTGDGALHATGGIDNTGEIDLGNQSVALSGGLFDNHGLLRGNGQVANRVSNHSDGEIRVGTGQTIRFTGSSNSNSGEIRLINGGTVEFTESLANDKTGRIAGRGVLIVDGGLQTVKVS